MGRRLASAHLGFVVPVEAKVIVIEGPVRLVHHGRPIAAVSWFDWWALLRVLRLYRCSVIGREACGEGSGEQCMEVVILPKIAQLWV